MSKAAPSAALKIDLARARAHWHSRQSLGEPFPGSIGEAVASTGWLRTLGGTDVYLAARARRPGMKRSELDQAQESSQVQVSPAARGCIYLVPAVHAPLALRIAEDQHRKRIERELEKAGSSLKEVTERAEAVLATLQAKGALTTDALRRAAPAEAFRSLGEQGKKTGVSSTLGPSLRELEFAGKIERTLEGGRLDTERYLWAPAKKKAHARAKVPDTAEGRNALLAELFFGWGGPATTKDFAEWAGLALRDAKVAVEKAPLAPISVDGFAADALVLAADLARLKEPQKPSKAVRLLSSEDNFLILHGGPGNVTDARHHGRKLAAFGTSGPTTIGEAKHITSRVIVTGDGLAGFWEYDPDAAKIVTMTFDPLSAAQAKELAALAAETATFLKEEMGHAKTFSLDTEEEIRKRAGAIKAM